MEAQAIQLDQDKKFLKYLFVVRFADGSTYEQNEDDKPIHVEKGSCFTDVLKLSETSPIVQAALTDGNDTWVVDLTTGDFTFYGKMTVLTGGIEHNDQSSSTIRLHDREVNFYNKRLVLFRRRYIDSIDGVCNVDESKVQYAFGWQGNVSPDPTSENKQFFVFID